MAQTHKKKRFQMLRDYTPADLITLANASCGTISLFICLNYLDTGRERAVLWPAFVLLPLALVFDALDGYVARKQKRTSLLGADLDSLADIVSFGVAPAVLAYTLGMRGGWDMAVLVYFVVCGISRLARFNVTSADLTDVATKKVRYFEGTPIPSSILLVVILGIAFFMGDVGPEVWFGGYQILDAGFHPLVIMFAISGSAMISSHLRVPKP